MINALASGASALDIFSRQQELVSSNLAHLNTPGYRRMLFSFHEGPAAGANSAVTNEGASSGPAATDFSPGRFEATDRTLDLAIKGDAFFVYQGAESELYSKSGVLFRGPEGQLRNGDGLPILGDGEPIIIPPDVSDFDITIDAAGIVSANGNELGKISMVTFDDNRLLKNDSQTYFLTGNAVSSPAEDTTIEQGFRELSNATPVSELVSLIIGSRHFEAAQRVIRTISETIQESTRA